MSVNIKTISSIKMRLGIQSGGPVHAFFTETCYKHMMPFVPGGVKSHLNASARLEIDSITYQSPDAHYLYIGKLYVDPKYNKGAFYSEDYGFWSRKGITKVPTNKDLEYHTPGTGSFWDKKMVSSKMKEIEKEVQEYVNRGCKK